MKMWSWAEIFNFFFHILGNVTTSEISWPLVILNFLNILSLQSLISKCFLITRIFFLTVSQETFGNKIPLLLSKTRKVVLQVKKKRFKKIAWIQSHHLYLQWKYKLLVGKFPWDTVCPSVAELHHILMHCRIILQWTVLKIPLKK